MKDLIEYFWNEQNQVGSFVYEDDRTGELTLKNRMQPMAATDKSVDQLRDEYFTNLRYWLFTQPQYD